MTCSAFFKKPLPLFCCFFLLVHTAQSQDNQPALAPGFLNEIGLDFAPFVRGQQGGSLIYKHRIGSVKVKKWQKQTALRVVAGFYKDPIVAGDYQYQRNDTLFKVGSNAYKANRFFADIGLERQLDRNRFRFYYGAEVGYRGSRSKPVSRIEAIVQDTAFVYSVTQTNFIRNGPEVSVFSGGQYRFLPHFSLGLEVHLSFGLEFNTNERVRNNGPVATDRNLVFVGATNLLHLLYLSYHF